MLEIALVRIDERLIHGQVMSAWIQYANSHHIIIVDDATAKDPFLKMILSAAVPGNLKVDITTVEDAKNVLEKADDRVVILVKKPEPLVKMVESGAIKPEKVILGGMSSIAGRERLYKSIYASKEELTQLKELQASGINVVVQVVPNDMETNLKQMLGGE